MRDGTISETDYLLIQKIHASRLKRNKMKIESSDDDSIIDISDFTFKIQKKDTKNQNDMGSKNKLKKLRRLREQQTGLFSYKGTVPYWEFKQIYFYAEITQATPAQKAFYTHFKENFLNGKYIDVEGNVNYLSILVHEMFSLYQRHGDFEKVENELTLIGAKYPETGDFTHRMLQGERNRLDRIERFRAQIDRFSNFGYNYFSNYQRLGDNFKDNMELNEEEVELLNLIDEPNNNFFNIPFVSHEIIRLFLNLVTSLEEDYKKEKTTLETIIKEISDVIAKKEHNFRRGS